MKRKALFIGALIAVLCIGIVRDADAHRRGYRREYGYGYRPHRVWIAPPPPPVVVIHPRYGYHRGPYYAPRHHGNYGRPYAYRSRHYRR